MEHNQRLRDDLARPRIRVSEASARFAVHISLHTGRSLTSNFLFHQSDSLLQNDN